MIFQNLKKDRSLQKDLLTKEFQNRDLEDWFFKETNKEIERIEKKEIKDWEDHFHLLELNRRMYHHPNQNPRMKPGGQTIVKMGEQLDLVYLLERAAIINEKIFRNRILKNENHDVEQELRIWKMAAEGIEHPAIDLYKIRFKSTDENKEEKYYELRDTFIEKHEELNEKEQKIHLVSLLNDASNLMKARIIPVSERLPLLKLGLKTKALFHEGKLTRIVYASIVSTGNTQGDFNFTKGFIDTYSIALDLHIRNDGIIWAKAHTAYYQKEFDDCLDLLLNNDFKTQYFQILTRILTTQVYFDLYLENDSYQSFLFNYFDSFEKWIAREKLHSKRTKQSYLRFIQTCRAVAKSYSSINFQAEKINNLLEQESNIQAPKWLKQKINKIIELKIKGRSKFV